MCTYRTQRLPAPYASAARADRSWRLGQGKNHCDPQEQHPLEVERQARLPHMSAFRLLRQCRECRPQHADGAPSPVRHRAARRRAILALLGKEAWET